MYVSNIRNESHRQILWTKSVGFSSACVKYKKKANALLMFYAMFSYLYQNAIYLLTKCFLLSLEILNDSDDIEMI
jgi:hypothetical protein